MLYLGITTDELGRGILHSVLPCCLFLYRRQPFRDPRGNHYRPPKFFGIRSIRVVGDVPSPASWTTPSGRAVREKERDWVFEEKIARPRCHCHVVLYFLSGRESLEVSVNAVCLGLAYFQDL